MQVPTEIPTAPTFWQGSGNSEFRRGAAGVRAEAGELDSDLPRRGSDIREAPANRLTSFPCSAANDTHRQHTDLGTVLRTAIPSAPVTIIGPLS
jgi:hypothetical protein